MPDAQTCALLAASVRAAIGGASEVASREDSRAFGAMLEARVAEAWPRICAGIGAEALPRPGARTIYDLALRRRGVLIGLDLKTRDLDSGRYSDGGVCAVGNLLRFLVNDGGVLLIGEITHAGCASGGRLLREVRVAPLHLMPPGCIRIENLGTGQVRLDTKDQDPWTGVDWDQSLTAFLDAFTTIAIAHYEHVGEVARQRANSMQEFRASGFTRLRLR